MYLILKKRMSFVGTRYPANANFPNETPTPGFFSPSASYKENSSSCPTADQWKEKANGLWEQFKSSLSYFKEQAKPMLGMAGGKKNKNKMLYYKPAMKYKNTRRRRRSTKKGGSANPYQMLTDVASHAAPISGIRTAYPHQITYGGKKRYTRKSYRGRR